MRSFRPGHLLIPLFIRQESVEQEEIESYT